MVSASPASATYDVLRDIQIPGDDDWKLGTPPRVRLIDHPLNDALGELQGKISFLKDNTSLIHTEKISSVTANILSLARQLKYMVFESGLSSPRTAYFKNLPLELRQQIWQFAIQAPQNITAEFKYQKPKNP
jgi:hypothetical protein